METNTPKEMTQAQIYWVDLLHELPLRGWEFRFVHDLFSRAHRIREALSPKQALWVGKLIQKYRAELTPERVFRRRCARWHNHDRERRYHRLKHG